MALKEKIIDRAQKHIQKGNIDKAIAEYRAAADVDPKDINIRLRIGELYVKINRTADAIKEYNEAAKANTQRGFYLKAIAVYKQVLKLDDNIEVHYKLADLYTRQRLIADAVSEYSYIVAMFERKGKLNDVLELLKKMIEIDPENIGIRIKLAELYHKLSFNKDALVEYQSVFARLMEQGKLEKAEKVYRGLFNSNPKEPVILKGLSELYAKKGDSAQFLNFATPLFHVYRDTGDTEGARDIAVEILRRRPDDPGCIEFMKGAGSKAAPVAEQSVSTEPAAAQDATGPVPESWTDDKASKKKEAVVAEAGKPLSSLEEEREEEIEITLEGFEDAVAQEAKGPSEAIEEEPAVAAPEEPSAGDDEAKEEPEVEIDIDLVGLEEEAPRELPVPAEPVAEVEAEPLVEFEELKAEVEDAQAPVAEEEPAVEIEVEAPADVEEIIVAAEPEAAEPEAAPSESIEAASGEDESFDVSLEDVLEEAIEEVNLKISEAEERQSLSTPAKEPGREAFEVPVGDIEQRIEALLEEEPEDSGSPDIFEGLENTSVPASGAVTEVEAVREASEAITELIEKTEASGPGLIERMSPDDMLIEPERLKMEEVPEGGKTEEYVDLSAELGMEETVQDMAGSWGGADSKEAYDEFKSGISQQLSKEDTETHYNLGIAYMEMELFSEASKEFKIALKDPHLEFDCLTRLGLCAMSEGNASEAIAYYHKGLKIEGKNSSERMGMMYELALAYEAAGNKADADKLFNAIYDADPDYREVATKVTLSLPDAANARQIPLDDGVIEVELL
jgi:tetratricopeptide (TPR) repeat protein